MRKHCTAGERLYWKLSWCSPPPPPHPIEPGGTYARSPSPEPPISGKGYTPYLGYWLPLAIPKTPHFPGFLGKSSRYYAWLPKYPPPPFFLRKWEYIQSCGPSCIRAGGGGDVHKHSSSNVPGQIPFHRLNSVAFTSSLSWSCRGVHYFPFTCRRGAFQRSTPPTTKNHTCI